MSTDIPNILNNILDVELEISFENDDPTVGILMPCYNHGHCIKDAIDSVITQDYQNKILIIIDDKSTDDSYEVISNLFDNIFQQILDRNNETIIVGKIQDVYAILIGRPTNQRQSAGRNKGITTSWNYCDYYCQLDADDQYLPNKLSKSMEVATSDPVNIGLVYCDVLINNEMTGCSIPEFREPYNGRRLEQEDIVSNAPVINKKALEEVGLYDESYPVCEDFELWLRICEKYIAIHIPEILQQYRVTPQSCTFTDSQDIWNKQWSRIRQKIVNKYSQ